MSSMIQVALVGNEKLVAKFDTYVGRFREELKTAMNVIVFTLVRYVQENKLSGQVLHRRTGTLSRSIKGIVTENAGAVIGNVTSRDRGNAPLAYAAYHELGFNGQMTVRAHMRKTMSGGEASVRSYVRTVHYPAHPFMKPTRDENKEFITKTLQDAVKRTNAQ